MIANLIDLLNHRLSFVGSITAIREMIDRGYYGIVNSRSTPWTHDCTSQLPVKPGKVVTDLNNWMGDYGTVCFLPTNLVKRGAF